MELIKVDNYKDMSRRAADIIIDKVKRDPTATLGLATGGTPIGLYQELILDHKKNGTSYQRITTFNLDEYVGIDKSNPNSYYSYMQKNLFEDINANPKNTHIPNGQARNIEKECERYEQLIATSGPIDIQLLGIGENGHIGFNEPGTSFQSRTQIVTLTDSTREANARFFSSIDQVPTHAITMGSATIMRSKEIILLVSGENKAKALEQLVNGGVSEMFPASVLQKHPNVTVIADELAISSSNTLSTPHR